MADAGIDLSIRTDSTQAAAGVREVEEAVRRAGRTSDDSSRRSADAAQRNLQLYREETRILDLRARNRHDIADALQREVEMRRMGMRLERELRVSEQEGLALARRRLALERELAEQTARRGAGGAGGGAGGGSGGGPPPPAGGGGGSGGGPPPPGGGRGGRGNPPPGGGGGLRDLGITYQILQDGIQGGMSMGLAGVAIGTANQVPQLLALLAKYKTAIMGATTAFGVLATGVTAGYAAADWDGFRDLIGRLFTSLEEEVEATNQWNDAQRKRLNDYNRRRRMEQAGERGAAEGGNAANRAEAHAQGVESRAASNADAERGRQRQMEQERLRLEGMEDEEARARKLRDLDKAWLLEKAERTKKSADYEYERAVAANKEAEAELHALEEVAKKAKLATGANGTNEELERIKEARKGIEAAAQTTRQLLRAAGDRRNAADTGVVDANAQAAQMDQKFANEKQARERREREARAAKEAAEEKTENEKNAAMAKQAGDALRQLGKGIGEFIDDVREKSRRISQSRSATDRDLEIMELRARGQGPKADRLERRNAINDRAKDFVDTEGRTPAEAARMAEREYDLRNPSRRIRGAGFRRAGGGEATGGGLDQPIGGGIDGTGGLDALRRLNDRGRKVGGSAGDKPSFAGLDGLDALQNRNRRIRGAGFKESKSVTETQASPATAAAGGAALPAILNAISGLGRKFDALISASRSIRR